MERRGKLIHFLDRHTEKGGTFLRIIYSTGTEEITKEILIEDDMVVEKEIVKPEIKAIKKRDSVEDIEVNCWLFEGWKIRCPFCGHKEYVIEALFDPLVDDGNRAVECGNCKRKFVLVFEK